MSRSLLAGAKPVVIAAVVAFLGAELADTANMLQLSTLHAAGLAGLAAGLRALYASLGPLQRGAAATTRAARQALTRPGPDAVGISRGGRRMHIGIVVQVSQAHVGYADLKQWLPALKSQLHDFCKAWGVLLPNLTIYSAQPPHVDHLDLMIAILDNSDQADALGYHDETDLGVPYARVFALDCEKYGVSVSSCVSHELLEAIADLACDRWAQAADGRLWALEVCDPVEADTYTVNGVELSSYVTPAFFDPHGAAPYDALDKLKAPFTMSTGGYGIVMTGGNVSQIYGSKKAAAGKKAWDAATKRSPLSRTARRLDRG